MVSKIVNILFWLSFLWMFSGCNSDQEPWTEEKSMDVYFRLVVEGDDVQTSRGTWNSYDAVAGSAFDSRINTEAVQVFVYETEPGTGRSQYVGEVKDMMCYTVSDNSSVFQYVGKILKNNLKVGGSYKFMAFVNGQPVRPSAEGLFDAPPVFNINSVQPDPNAEPHFLPMWGVETKMLTGGTDGELLPRYDLGDICLLRAVAKVELRLSAEMAKTYSIVSATVSRGNSLGNLLPGSWNKVSRTQNLSYKDEAGQKVPENAAFNPNSETPVSDYMMLDGETESHKVVYLPEYKNTLDNESVISVVVENSETKQMLDFADNVRFRKYTSSGEADLTAAPYDIERNFNYRFTVSKIVEDQLAVTCEAVPWNLAEQSWEYSDEVSVLEGDEIKWVEGTYQKIDYLETGEVIMKPGTRLHCNFKISGPAQAVWFASFTPKKGKKDAFRFYRDADDVVGSAVMSGNVGESSSLIIGATENQVDQVNMSSLSFVVRTCDGRTLKVLGLQRPYYDNYIIVQSN